MKTTPAKTRRAFPSERKVPVVVVEVEGGCVQSVYISGDPRQWPHVFVADYDNARAGEEDYVQEQCPLAVEFADDVLIDSVADQLAVHKPPGKQRRKHSKL